MNQQNNNQFLVKEEENQQKSEQLWMQSQKSEQLLFKDACFSPPQTAQIINVKQEYNQNFNDESSTTLPQNTGEQEQKIEKQDQNKRIIAENMKASNIKRNCWKCVGNLFRKYIQKQKDWDRDTEYRDYVNKYFIYDKVSKQDWKTIFSQENMYAFKLQTHFKCFVLDESDGEPIFKIMLKKMRQSGNNLNRQDKIKIYENFIQQDLKNLYIEQSKIRKSKQPVNQLQISYEKLQLKKDQFLNNFNAKFQALLRQFEIQNQNALLDQQEIITFLNGNVPQNIINNNMQNAIFQGQNNRNLIINNNNVINNGFKLYQGNRNNNKI